jgi:hypothetical protein
LKTVWKVSNEKYEGIEKEKTSTEHKWTSKMPALSNDKGLFANSIAPLSKTVKGDTKFSLAEETAQTNSEYGIANYTENQYNSDELYTATDDFIKQVLPNDRSSFARSLAYRTTGMKKGEVRTLVILGADSQAYCFKADGYMHGKMIKTFEADNKEILESILNEYDTIDQSAEDAALWTEAFQSNKGGIGSSGSIFERGQSDFANTLYADTPERYGTRNNERSGQNYQYDRAELDETIKKLKEIYGIDDDTHYSLSKEGDIAPVGRYTGLAIEEDVAPTTEDTEGERIARVLTKEPVHVGKDKS